MDWRGTKLLSNPLWVWDFGFIWVRKALFVFQNSYLKKFLCRKGKMRERHNNRFLGHKTTFDFTMPALMIA